MYLSCMAKIMFMQVGQPFSSFKKGYAILILISPVISKSILSSRTVNNFFSSFVLKIIIILYWFGLKKIILIKVARVKEIVSGYIRQVDHTYLRYICRLTKTK